MKMIKAMLKSFRAIFFIVLIAFIAAFFVAVFNPDGVERAIGIIKGLLS